MRKGRMSQRERAIQEPDCHAARERAPWGGGEAQGAARGAAVNLLSRRQGTRVCIFSDQGAKRGLGGYF